MPTVAIPEWYYSGVGRFNVASNALAANMGYDAALLEGRGAVEAEAEARKMMTNPRDARRRLRNAIEKAADSDLRDRLTELADEAAGALQERGDLTHAVVYLDFPTTPGEFSRWLVWPPRWDEPIEMPDSKELIGLANRMMKLARKFNDEAGFCAVDFGH